jgi:hypothetical protein
MYEKFQNGLWGIFGHNRAEVTEGWRKLQDQKLHKLYSSPDINRMMKSRRTRWTGDELRLAS